MNVSTTFTVILHISQNSTIFKTHESNLDSISSKLGFSKRSFAEWNAQVWQSFDDAGKGLNGFKEALRTAFTVPVEMKDIKLIAETDFAKIFPVNDAEDFFKKFNQEGSESIATLTQWCGDIGIADDTMRSYLIECMQKQAPASFKGYEQYVNSAIASNQKLSLSTELLKTALNAATYFVISQATSFVVTKIDEFVNRAKNAKEAADKLASTLKSANNSLGSQRNLIERVEESYEKLSKGVDSLGNNVSLSKDDFADYQDICNQIAEYYPKMVSAWTKEGNAVVDLKNKVYDLKTAYEEERIAALNSFVSSADNIVDSYNLNADYSSSNGYDHTSGYKQKIAALQAYLDVLTNVDESEQLTEIQNLLENGGKGFSGHDLQNALKNVDISKYKLDQLPSHISAVIKNLQTELSQEDNSMKQMLINMFTLDSNDYKNISDEAYQIGTSFINSLDSSFFDSKNAGDYREFVDDLLDQLTGENANKISSIFNSLVNLDKEKNNLTATEYKYRIDKIITDLQTYLDIDENAVKLMVNAQIYEDDLTFQSIDTMINNVKTKLQNDKDKVSELSYEDLQIAANLSIPNDTLLTWDELKQKIQEVKDEAALDEQKNFDFTDFLNRTKEDLKSTLENIKLFKDAISKINNGEALDYDTMTKLIELDPSLVSDFTNIADGYTISVDKLIKANNKFKENPTNNIQQGIDSISQNISDNEAKIRELIAEKQKLEAGIKENRGNDHYNGSKAYGRLLDIDEEIEAITNAIKNSKDVITVYKLAIEELNSIPSISLDDLFKGYEVLNTVTEEFNNKGNISYDTLQNITSAYPSLKSAVDDYLLGIIDENEFISKLSDCYSRDENDYYNYLLNKAGYDDNCISAALGGSDNIVNYFAENYGVDLKNFQTYIERKQAIQDKFDGYVAGGLSKYFDENGNVTSDFLALTDQAKSGIQSIYAQYQDAIKELDGFELKDKTNNALNSMLNSNNISGSSSSSFTPKTYNWIETAIDKVKKAVSKLSNVVGSTFKSWTTRNGALKDQISEVTKEIALQEKAYNAYMKKADAVGLPDYWAEMVRSGAVEISEIKDEGLADKIDGYREWYEKAQDCKDAIDELNGSLAELYENKFNNISKEFEDRLNEIQHLSNKYDIGIDTVEAKGYLSSIKLYSALTDNQRESLKLLKKELSELQAAFSEALEKGDIAEYSEDWFTLKSSINDVSEEILKANQTLAEYAKTMREIEWEHFDYLQERISNITGEADFLIDLIGDADMFDGKGNYTADGLSVLGLHAQSYNVYMAQADKYYREMLAIEKDLASDPYNTDLIERKEELLELQQKSITSAEDEKQAMIDLAKNGIEEAVNSLNELIDAYTDALDAAKELHDYQRKIAEQTSVIASLEKQLAAYEGDNSEETRATVQKIKSELDKAKDDLKETEYDRYISDQKELLNELSSEYKEQMNQRMDNVDVLLEELIAIVNDNSGVISSTVSDAAKDVGYILSNDMEIIWNNAANSINDTVALYGSEFSDKLTNINEALSKIEINTAAMTSASDKAAQSFTYSSSHSSSTGTNSAKTVSDKGSSSGNASNSAVPSSSASDIKVGSMINASGALIYDYAGDTTGVKQYFASDPIYTVLSEINGYLKVRWHNANSGVTGWFKKEDVKAYKNGGLVNYTGLAQLDGTPSNPEYVLNSADTKNFFALNKALEDVDVKKLLGISSAMPKIEEFVNTNGFMSDMRAMQNADFSANTTFGDINISVDHVEDYDDFVNQLRNDRQFEKMVQAMTIDRAVGRSALAKNKFRW